LPSVFATRKMPEFCGDIYTIIKFGFWRSKHRKYFGKENALLGDIKIWFVLCCRPLPRESTRWSLCHVFSGLCRALFLWLDAFLWWIYLWGNIMVFQSDFLSPKIGICWDMIFPF
jgi:hypothetical protein